MISRFRFWLYLAAVALTQGIFNTCGAGLWWVITGRGSAPNPDEPLSSRVGRAAMKNKTWALWAEHEIDSVLGEGHCRESARVDD